MLRLFMISLAVIANFECVFNLTAINFDTISECIVKVCNKDLRFRSTIILKYESDLNGNKSLFFNEMIEKLSVNNIQKVILNEIDESNEVIATEEADWLVVGFLSLLELQQALNLRNIRGNIKYLIVLSDILDKYCNIYLDEIKYYVAKYDVTFIIKRSSTSRYEFITYIPQIDEQTCLEVVKEPVKINTCVNGFIDPVTVFPIKNPKNLNNCPLNIGIGTLFPFAVIKNKENFKTFDRLEEKDVNGSDIAIVKIIAKQFNASFNLHYVNITEENPQGQYDFIPFMLNGSLDICAGGFYRIYQDFVAYSGIYARQSIIWVYTVERTKRSWSNLITKLNGFSIFFTFYLCYSFIWYSICKFDDRAVTMRNTLLYSWGALFSADGLPNASSVKQMILNLSYLVMCIHLSAYISIQFYSYYTILEPPELLLSTDDLMKSGRTLYLVTISKYFVSDENFVRFANTSEECFSFMDCLKKCLLNKGITAMMQGIFLNFQAITSVNEEAKVLSTAEHLLTVYYEMLIRKSSPYIGRFQKIIQRLFEGGIPERLFTEALGFSIIGKAKRASENMTSNSYSCQTGCKISLDQIIGVFYVWAIGCVFAICIFILEIVLKQHLRVDSMTVL